MTELNQQDFRQKNHETIMRFMKEAGHDNISGCVQATIAQFLLSTRIELNQRAGDKKWVTPLDIIDSQVNQLRQCVLDLLAHRERLTDGVTKQ